MSDLDDIFDFLGNAVSAVGAVIEGVSSVAGAVTEAISPVLASAAEGASQVADGAAEAGAVVETGGVVVDGVMDLVALSESAEAVDGGAAPPAHPKARRAPTDAMDGEDVESGEGASVVALGRAD